MATASTNDPGQILNRAAEFRKFDAARQEQLEAFLEEYIELKKDLTQVRGDLDDERSTKRLWRQRAEEAEAQINRRKFVLVLVDGDGYKFKNEYLRNVENGGAKAAEKLLLDVQSYVRAKEILTDDYEVMVNIYANKTGLSLTLVNDGTISRQSQLEQFFCNFTQSHSLFNFIDSGTGKERADAKLRDTYNFFAMTPQCRHIFLMCSHDQGYLTELTKINNAGATKTTLVHGATVARAYSSLQGFSETRFTVFEDTPPATMNRATNNGPISTSPVTQHSRPDYGDGHPQMKATAAPFNYPPATASATTPRPPWRSDTSSGSGRLTPPDSSELPPSRTISAKPVTPTVNPKGVAVNRLNERIDLPLRQPNAADLNRFADRVDESGTNLCNDFHLLGRCDRYACPYDHDPIDDSLRNTLRLKARGLPCKIGSRCRKLECYNGHHCPWRDRCDYGKGCNFYKYDLHIDDLDVARIIPPTAS